MDFSWTPKQEQLRKDVVEFARQSLSCDMIKHDREGVFNHDAWNKCGDFGVHGWLIPSAYGGGGLDILTTIYGMQALGYACKDNGMLFGMNAHIWACEMPLLSFGNNEQKEKYLPLLASGRWIGAHAATEPQAGSDIFNLTTIATKEGDEYIINGTKHYVTNGAVADLFIVFASIDLALGEKGLTVFLIEKGTPGLEITPVIPTMGDRTAQVTRLKLNNCVVPVRSRLGEEGAGMTIFTHSMEWERGFILSTAVGTMQRILEQSIDYARKHKQFGQSIAKFQLVSTKLVDMKLLLESAKMHLYKMAWMKEQRKIALLEAAITNLFISEAWVELCMKAIEIHGGNGYMTELELERELRDAIGSKFYSGTSEIQRTVIAKFIGA